MVRELSAGGFCQLSCILMILTFCRAGLAGGRHRGSLCGMCNDLR